MNRPWCCDKEEDPQPGVVEKIDESGKFPFLGKKTPHGLLGILGIILCLNWLCLVPHAVSVLP